MRLHLVDAPLEERWRRVQARNEAPDADQLPFRLTREMFDFVEAMWERPDPDELAALDGVVVDSGPARD